MPPNQQNSQDTSSNDIFKVQPPPPPTPEEKKRTALWITISMIIGFAIFIALIFFALFMWANGAANSYRNVTSQRLAALTNEVEAIDIDAILNRRDTSELQQEVQQFVKEQPSLNAVILAETTSVLYRATQDIEQRVNEYNQKVVQFVDSLPGLLQFSNAIEKTDNDVTKLLAESSPETAQSARTVAGTIDEIAEKLATTETPQPLVALRDELVAAYRQLAEGYRDLAASFEGPQISQAQANRRIDDARRTIAKLNKTDLTKEVEAYRTNLVKEGETLQSQLQ